MLELMPLDTPVNVEVNDNNVQVEMFIFSLEMFNLFMFS